MNPIRRPLSVRGVLKSKSIKPPVQDKRQPQPQAGQISNRGKDQIRRRCVRKYGGSAQAAIGNSSHPKAARGWAVGTGAGITKEARIGVKAGVAVKCSSASWPPDWYSAHCTGFCLSMPMHGSPFMGISMFSIDMTVCGQTYAAIAMPDVKKQTTKKHAAKRKKEEKKRHMNCLFELLV